MPPLWIGVWLAGFDYCVTVRVHSVTLQAVSYNTFFILLFSGKRLRCLRLSIGRL
jgi:hypothetical protein